MNAIAPPPKRLPGTGTVGFHRASKSWRYRTPGRAGVEVNGYASREAAENALNHALRGLPEGGRRQMPLLVLRATMRYALELAFRLEIDFDEELRFMRAMRARRAGT